MTTRRIGNTTVRHLLDDERVRKTDVDGRPHYAAADIVGVLSDAPDTATARQDWEDLKHHHAALRSRCVKIELPGAGEPQDVLPLGGVLRIVQELDAPRAERLRTWLADVAAQAVEEEEDPELAIQRMRQGYEAKGFNRRWIDHRLRAVSARHEVVGEWYKRGVKENEQFRLLTNALLHAAFGMDTPTLRAHKGLTNTGRSLRDHMTDLELSLLSLAETTAASLHRRRDSSGIEQLMQDVTDAGRIIRRTGEEIDAAVRPAVPSAA